MCTYKNRFLTEGLVPFKGQCNGVNRFMFVYVIRCTANDKYYVGQHRCKPHINDPLNDNYRGSGLILKRFKAKYDWFKDFTFTILEFCESNTQLNQRELFWLIITNNNIIQNALTLLPQKISRISKTHLFQ